MTNLPRFSNHAADRWAARCKGMDQEEEWRRARPISAKRLAKLTHHSGRQHNHRPGAEYRLSPAGVVFVLCGQTVITVWTLHYCRSRQAYLDGKWEHGRGVV